MIQQNDNVWDNQGSQPVEISNAKQNINKSGIDINFRRVLSVWPYTLLFAILAHFIGLIYLRYVNIIYNASTSINIEVKNEITLGEAFSGSQRDPFNDKLAYIKSPAVASILVDKLNLRYHAIAQGKIKDKDYYGTLEWTIIDSIINDGDELFFTLVPNKIGFSYSFEKTKGEAAWGQPFLVKGRQVVVRKIKEISSDAPVDCFSVDKTAAAFDLSNSLQIESSKESNILKLTYSDFSAQRAKDILNNLVDVYNIVLTKDKSLSYSQAIDFIDNRLTPMARELDSIETALASFKSSRRFFGNSANGELYMQKVQENEKQLIDVNNLKTIIAEVEKFIQNPNIADENLALMGITDPTLQNNIRSYQDARKERDKLATSQTSTNPGLIFAEKILVEIKNNINIQLQNYKQQLAETENNYQGNLRESDNLLKSTPMDEKELLDKQRMMTIKETLFQDLLQKKEEASIARASITVGTKVLYPPVILSSGQTPSRSQVLLAFLLTGLLIPLVYALIREVLNRKIISKKQLQRLTSVPVIAELEQAEKVIEGPFVIAKNSRSMFGEQVRSLRTNLEFFKNMGKSTSYILLTSSVSGEGKTFISINLAKSYSLQGKKVALLEFDLRRPKISKEFDLASDRAGMSTFLIGKCEIAEVIQSIAEDGEDKFDLFTSGPIPPNPQELMSSPGMDKLKEYLDANYDIIVIDSPPFGMVADAQILGKWADVTLIITRYYQTIFDQIEEINDWKERAIFPSMSIILNGVLNTGYFGNKYGYYYYRRKYGYGYYTYGYYGGKDKDSNGKKKGIY